MMVSTSPILGGLVLLAAGIFQWTPLKYTCLAHCRSPLGFLMTDWREGVVGAFLMGLRHGSYCLGCCGLLMALLFVAGVMNLMWLAILIGCAFLITAYLRTRLAEIEVYPSVAVLRSSLTILIVGAYLLVVGGLAEIARRFEVGTLFQWQAIIVLVGMAGLAVLLLSDRTRQRIHVFVVRHFSKAKHDAARVRPPWLRLGSF